MGHFGKILGEKWFLYFSAFSVNLLTVALGNAYSWTSPVLPVLYDIIPGNPLPRPITTNEESWITALLSLGAACGPIVAGFSAGRFGRKRTLVIFSQAFLVSYIILAFATSIEYYLAARFILGVGGGSVFTVVPMYVGEIAENTNRGVLGCFMGVCLTFGLLMCYTIGPFTDIFSLTLICLIPCVLFLVLFGIFGPESPYYLISVDRKEEAKACLIKLHNKTDTTVEKELDEIARNIEKSKANKGGFRELFRSKAGIRSLLITVGTMFFQQFAGITVVLSYLQPIFESTGSSIPSDVSAIVVGFIQFFINILASQLVDRLGRRKLLITSAAGCFVSLMSLGIFFYMKNQSYDVEPLFWLPIASLTLYICTYNLGLGPLAWAVVGEVFAPNLKSLCSTLTTCFCLTLAFLLTVLYPSLSLILGLAQSFWLFSVCCALGIVFFLCFLPETKGKSLEEIQIMLGAKS